MKEGIVQQNRLQAERFPNFDGLRTLAAVCVLIMHVFVNSGFDAANSAFGSLLYGMATLVQLFFIISGFGMCCGYYDKIKSNQINIESFYSKRYARILPFFSLLVALDLLVSIVLNGEMHIESIYEALADITLGFGFFATEGMNVIGVGWTLGVIFGFYMLFPFFVYMIWTKKRAWVSLVITLWTSFAIKEYFGSQYSALTATYLYCFVAGGLMYLYRESICKWIRSPLIGVALSVLGFAMAFFAKLPPMGVASNLMDSIKYTLGFALILMGAMGPRHWLWSNPLTRFISGISLEIYLSHMLVFRALEKFNMIHLFGNNMASYIITCILTLIGTIAFACCYQWAEKKIRKTILAIKGKKYG